MELGCGNASLLCHVARWNPRIIIGIDLGNSVQGAKRNVSNQNLQNAFILQSDLNSFSSRTKFDLVYCIGVLHHLRFPEKGFHSALKFVKPGGKFHFWVYGKEGNNFVIYFVDPLRKIASKLPWWLIKFGIALPLATGLFFFSRLFSKISKKRLAQFVPLFQYFQWLTKRDFGFHRHVVFDQLVAPKTDYFPKEMLENWLKQDESIDPSSIYIIHRNGNSWKFGGSIRI